MSDQTKPREGLECGHCGHHGTAAEPVRWYNLYVGGHGYTWRAECDDVRACWARWDALHLRLEVTA